MKLGYAFLANYAEQMDDGRFSVINAGIDGFLVKQLPETIAQKFIVAHFEFAPEDCGREYEFSLSLTEPSGQEHSFEGGSLLTPQRDKHFPDRPGGISTIFPIYKWDVSQTGIYMIKFYVGKKYSGSLSIGIAIESNP
jgi:hypothetical protein